MSKKIILINVVSLSVIFIYGILLFSNFNTLPDEIPIHNNFKGEVDGYGSKMNLFLMLITNLVLIAGIFFIVRKPHIANYPVEITEENKSKMYYRMQLFLSFLSVLTSLMFSFFIFEAFDRVTEYFYFMIATVIFPLTTILIMVKKS